MWILIIFWTLILVAGSDNLKCTNRPLDLAFVIDSSSSIFPNDFVRQLEFMENITHELDVGTLLNQTRVGVISYSDEPQLEFTLNDHTEKKDVVSAIRRIHYLSGGTNTPAAISLAVDKIFKEENGARKEADDIIVVITDGESFSENETKESALQARKSGIDILAIGIGPNVNAKELHLIAGNTKHVYQVSSYEDLRSIADKLMNTTCVETKDTITEKVGQKDTPLNKTVGQKDTPLNKTVGQKDTPLNRTIGQKDTPLNRTVGQKDTPLNKTVGQTDTPLNKTVGQKDTPLNKTVGQKDTPLNKTVGQKDTLLNKTVGQKDTPLNKTVGQKDTPLNKTVGQKDTPLNKTVGQKDTPLNKTAGQKDTPLNKTVGQKDTPLNKTVIVEKCGRDPADVLFLLDSSSSIHPNYFKKQLSFVKTIVSAFDVNLGKTAVGVSTFSDEFQFVFHFNDFTTKETIFKAIDNVPYLRGGTDTGNAIWNVRKYGFEFARSNVAHILILITDGLSRDPLETIKQASILKESGVYIFAIGVGPYVDRKELLSMASLPYKDNSFVYNVSTFDALQSIENLLATRTCFIARQQIEKYPLCAMARPVDILFAFNAASIGHLGTQLILNTLQKFGNLRFENGADIHLGIVSGSCIYGGDIPLQSLNTRLNVSFEKMTSIIRRVKTLGTSSKNGARSNADQVVVLVVNEHLEMEDEREIIGLETVVDQIYVVYVGDSRNKGTILPISSPVVKILSMNNFSSIAGLWDYFQEELCRNVNK